MKIPRSTSSRARPINMTPMIDVVFQLIVFFTATSTLAKNEFTQNLDLPIAEKGKERDESSHKKRITANILATGEVYVAGRQVNASAFSDMLHAELEQHSAEQLEVQFRADRNAVYASVEPLLLSCARQGVWQVSFSVQPPDR